MPVSLCIPALTPKYVVRKDLEGSLFSSILSGRNVIVTNDEEKLEVCSGKSSLLVSVVNKMLEEKSLKHVMWVDFGQYRHSRVPYKDLLVDVANELRRIFSNRLYAPTNLNHLRMATEYDVQVYIRELVCALRMEKIVEVEELTIVLDGVTHQTEVSSFAFLGLHVIVTTRFIETTQILEGDEGDEEKKEAKRRRRICAEWITKRPIDIPPQHGSMRTKA